MEIPKEKADRVLREHGGDVVAALTAVCCTCTKGINLPLEFRTKVAGTIRPLGSITGMVVVLFESGSNVW